jgi:nitroimidazol reductase NimA-like FMN-containing flavoprotein (pyridoxamine 5'-phosphate oxidase superfamily)
MTEPKITRPLFPKGYADKPKTYLSWDQVARKLTDAINYWICSVRPNGHPHAVPKWAVFVEDKIYYDGSPETRHAKNISKNPHVSLHLESGSDVVIVEGSAQEVQNPKRELTEKIAKSYSYKYSELGYSPQPDQWDDGGLYEIRINKVIAWTFLQDDPTKFVFDSE